MCHPMFDVKSLGTLCDHYLDRTTACRQLRHGLKLSLSASVTCLADEFVHAISIFSTPPISNMCLLELAASQPLAADEDFTVAGLQHLVYVCKKSGTPSLDGVTN